jgi:hypothetical protein
VLYAGPSSHSLEDDMGLTLRQSPFDEVQIWLMHVMRRYGCPNSINMRNCHDQQVRLPAQWARQFIVERPIYLQYRAICLYQKDKVCQPQAEGKS